MNSTYENSTGPIEEITETSGISPDHVSGITVRMVLTLVFLQGPGLISNILALIAIGKDITKAPIPTNILLFSLCFTDFFAICVAIMWHVVKDTVPIIPDAICTIKSIISPFCPIYSGCIGAFMAIDRFLALCMPYFYKERITVTTWKFAIKIAAVCLLGLCTFPVIGLGSLWKFSRGIRICSHFYYHHNEKERIFGYTYGLLGLTFVAVIMICNTLVVRIAIKLHQRVASQTETARSPDKKKLSHEVLFAKLVGSLTIVFIVCWTPFNILILLSEAGYKVHGSIKGGIHTLASLNYIVDPFVYIFIRKKCRQKIFRLCHQLRYGTVTET